MGAGRLGQYPYIHSEQICLRARGNVMTRCIAAGSKKSGIGYVLSELDDFAVALILIAIGLSTFDFR